MENQWIFIRYSSDSHRIFIGYSSDSHRIAIGKSSDSHQIFIGYSSDIHRIFIGYSSDIHRIFIGYSSDSHQIVTRCLSALLKSGATQLYPRSDTSSLSLCQFEDIQESLRHLHTFWKATSLDDLQF